MQVTVKMCAFYEIPVDRIVTIPEEEIPERHDEAEYLGALLEQVFFNGQNDFQSQPMCSVSVGDVALIERRFFICQMLGWREITEGQYQSYIQLTREQRMQANFCYHCQEKQNADN